MSHLVAIILGFVEGATEFIPVSSTGHLIIVRQIFGENNLGGLAFDAILQMATTFSLIAYFWKDIFGLIVTFLNLISKRSLYQSERTKLYAIVLGTIPAVIFGILLETYMDTVFRNVQLVAITLILGSILFWFAEKFGKGDKILSIGRGVMIGFFQCLALIPGISRSGATISGGLLLGLEKDEAVRFSFLLSIPVLLGAGLKKLFEVRSEIFTTDFGSALLLGSIVAFVVGLLSINFLVKYLRNHSLKVFIWYRIALAFIILIAVGF